MKRLATIILSILILAGCSAKSAEQIGKGISVEVSDPIDVKHMTLIKYVDGKEAFSENVINADNSPFENGDIIWFDVSPSATDSTVELAISYSENLDGTDAQTTEKINVSNANEWINVKFIEDFHLKLIDLE